MPVFKDHLAYWKFASSVKGKYRYFPTTEAKQFLESLKVMVGDNEARLSAGAVLARAQLGCDYRPLEDDKGHAVDEIPCALPPKRMKPLADRAREGRVNPKGIPYLYLSSDPDTAIAETRPWIGQYVSLALFKVACECRLVHFTEKRKRSIFYFSIPPKDEIDGIVWEDVNLAFSHPVQPDDHTCDYVPTQVIAEFIRSLGYDGIVYRSRLGDGLNIALFDLSAADLTSCELHRIDAVRYKHDLVDNPYFVSIGTKRSRSPSKRRRKKTGDLTNRLS